MPKGVTLFVPAQAAYRFRNDRRLLGDLCRVAAGVFTEGIRTLLDGPGRRGGDRRDEIERAAAGELLPQASILITSLETASGSKLNAIY